MARIISVITELNCFWVRSEELSYTEYAPGGSPNLCLNCCRSHGVVFSPSQGTLLALSTTHHKYTHAKLSGFSPYVGYRPCMQYTPTHRFTASATHDCFSLDCTSLFCVKAIENEGKALVKPKNVQLLSCKSMDEIDQVNLLSYQEFQNFNILPVSDNKIAKRKRHTIKKELCQELGCVLDSSMLQQILAGDGNIDPEILAELDEEQKQILFCKMREEQVRRYNKREKEEMKKAKKEKNNTKKKSNKKQVTFLTGKDKKEWVWVMGEHEHDKSIEQIVEEESIDKANKEAENEAKRFRLKEEEELARIKAEEEKLEKEKQEREELLRKQSEEEYQSAKEAQEAQKRFNEEKKRVEESQKKKIEELKRKKETRRSSIKEIEGLKSKRSSEIYLSIQEVRLRVEQEAKKSQQELEKEWKKQEEKAKRLESQIRQVARRARQEWRRSITGDENDLARVAITLLNKHKGGPATIPEETSAPRAPPRKPPGEKSSKPTRPTSRAAIVEWYKDQERAKEAGYDPKTHTIAPWFHGPISREYAEDILEEKSPGSFLVRVSERIFGYAISYRAEERCKHYLINALDGKYEFFGTNQISHNTLFDLVSFHKKKPISNTGQEILVTPCGQSKDPPDYAELFDQGQVTKL